MMRRLFTLLIAAVTIGTAMDAQNTVRIKDSDLVAGGTYYWSAANTYLVEGLTYLEAGGTLNIAAGTVVQFVSTPSDTTGGNNTSALIITKGAKIFVNGRADAPVIFTYEGDDVTDPTDINDPITRGQWGGLVVLGNAVIATLDGTDNIEGISAQEPRGRFGGTDNDESSGSIRYLSIRHGGRALSPGNEINGLTLGGVGRGTVIDYVEVFANADDGIEWFGGTVDVRHAAIAFGSDDSFDWDQGWRGRGQYWFSLNGADESGRAGEHDGAEPDDQAPFANPTVANATYIGSGVGATPGEEGNDFALLMRDNTGGKYYNSVFTDFPQKFLNLEDLPAAKGVDALQRLQAGDIAFGGNVLGAFGAGATAAELTQRYADGDQPDGAATIAAVTAGFRLVGAAQLVNGISRGDDGGLDPRPAAGSALRTGTVDVPDDGDDDDFFDETSYVGAFSEGNSWIEGWTALSHYGFTGNKAAAGTTIRIKDADLAANGTYTWTSNNTYLVEGLTYLEGGGRLNIEAGTVVQFVSTPSDTTGGNNTSALIITKGAKIFVNGRADAPVIFTYEGDDVTDPTDINDPITRGQWGGLVVLGNAVIATLDGTDNIEGISAQEPRGRFGGTDNDESSGAIRYLSIRHGGRALSPGNEINGLTLGGVGRGTVIDYVEVFANADDGIEWFGGTVDVRHAAIAFGSDDSFDWDQGWRGRGQYWFSLNGADESGRAGEHDGAEPDDQAPFANPTVANATYIGSGVGATPGEEGNDFALLMRDNTGGKYYNSVFTDFPQKFLNLEDLPAAKGVDALQRLQAGDIAFGGNVLGAFGAGATAAELTQRYADGDQPDGAATIAAVTAGFRLVGAAQLVNGISRGDDGGLDPRPAAGSALRTGTVDVPDDGDDDDFFDETSYVGAFNPNGTEFWAGDWTALWHYGFFNKNLITSSTKESILAESSVTIYPNPTDGNATLRYTLANESEVAISLFDVSGRVLSTERSTRLAAGTYSTELTTSVLPAGTYFVRIVSGGQAIVKSLVVATR